MKERPILFSGPMVRAILEGRKTQTRRTVTGKFALEWLAPDMFTPEYVAHPENGLCPFGAPGDRLWVRETHLVVGGKESTNPRVVYRASNDGEDAWLSPVWTPSIFMPRRFSRLTLEVRAVRIERLQEISEADAIAEGVERWVVGEGWREYGLSAAEEEVCGPPMLTARDSYQTLWDSINAKRGHGWETNPWVWVVEFERVAG